MAIGRILQTQNNFNIVYGIIGVINQRIIIFML
jgi:hypothetical protein